VGDPRAAAFAFRAQKMMDRGKAIASDYRQATNKIVGIWADPAPFLRGFF
jgi:hypothetical protein